MSVAGWLGVDVGWVYPAVDSSGQIYTWAKKEHRRKARDEFSTQAGPVTVTKANGTTYTVPAYGNEQIAAMLACGSHQELVERCTHLASWAVSRAFQACQGIALERWADDPRRNTRWRVMHSALMGVARQRHVPYLLVPRAYTSQTCPECGHVDAENRPARNSFQCVECGHTGQSDHIAARNIAARATRTHPPDPNLQAPASNEKRCTKCLEVKPLTEFWRNTGSKDGRNTRCGECTRPEHRNDTFEGQPCAGGRAAGRRDGRGICPTCGHLFGVRGNGKVWQHKLRARTDQHLASRVP